MVAGPSHVVRLHPLRVRSPVSIATRIASAKSEGTSDEQRAVLDAVRHFRKLHPHYGPSFRELARHLGVGLTDVWQKLTRLRRDGLVAWDDGVSRSIHVVEEQKA